MQPDTPRPAQRHGARPPARPRLLDAAGTEQVRRAIAREDRTVGIAVKVDG
ncbi:hypothetical protein [Amycolatopsis sp. NPDC051716]|uniref:hypothetical protein n=1 Tax=Amycolatopsis sp. NPDC051716 TaxID=3155804 RepID=UPI00343B443A